MLGAKFLGRYIAMPRALVLFVFLASTLHADPVPMRLGIVLDTPSCRAFENFTLKVRITNPNSFEVILPGFELGYIEPEIHVLGPDGAYHRLYYGPFDSAWRRTPVVVGAGASLEQSRFLYDGFHWERWPNEPGTFALRPKTHIETCKLKEDGDDLQIDWEIKDATLRVERATSIDRSGITFLQEKLQVYDAITDPKKQPVGPFRITLFAEFLHRYEESVYTPEIRWELTKLLQLQLGDQHSPLYADKSMQGLWSECVTFCLDRGGAFAEEITRWDPTQGGSWTMDHAWQIGDHELTKRIVGAIDARYPADQAAILHRRLIVEATSGNDDAATATAHELTTRFPKSEYAKDLPQAIEWLKRTSPKKPAGE